MSRLPKPGSKASSSSNVGGLRKPSSSTTSIRKEDPRRSKPPSRTNITKPPSVSVSKNVPPKAETRKPKDKFVMPALSTLQRREPKNAAEAAAAKRKIIRRNVPQGEDIKMMKEILTTTRRQKISVQEFVGLIAPYLGDNATLMREVMSDELSNFKIMSKKIYETMTQDVSDVLTNEHVQLMHVHNERYDIMTAKMMHAIDTILEYAPDFDFDAYHRNPAEYLATKFPLVAPLLFDPEQQDLLARQEAYHRLQWLRSEGDRLNDENVKLQERLKELKEMQKAEMQRKTEIETQAEIQKAQLEAHEEALQDQLHDATEGVEIAMIQQENELTAQSYKTGPSRPRKMRQPKVVRTGSGNWAADAAAEIESAASEVALETDLSKISMTAPSATGAKRKIPTNAKAKGGRRRPPPPGDTSPFHYSPPKSPPGGGGRQAQKQASPFHYSPPKTPPGAYEEQYSQARAPTPRTRVEKSTTVTEAIDRRGGNAAPRDQWGGFY